MGVEVAGGSINGLCNATVLATPKAGFIAVWQERIKEFDPNDWNKLAVRDPFSISRDFPYLIHIEPPESFFRLSWYPKDMDDAHKRTIQFERSYSLHLWETKTYNGILKFITEESVLGEDTSYNLLARKALGVN
jgi:hypothetical protein